MISLLGLTLKVNSCRCLFGSSSSSGRPAHRLVVAGKTSQKAKKAESPSRSPRVCLRKHSDQPGKIGGSHTGRRPGLLAFGAHLRHRHSLRGAAVQDDHAVDGHLPPLGVLLEVLPQVCGRSDTAGLRWRTWTRLRPLACPRGGLQEALKRRRSNRLHTDRSDLTASSKLTGDADRCLATLGGSQVAPGHTQAPVVLRAVEVLHLLAGHVDQDFTHLQT